jgi:hypothetical protein
MDKAPTSNSQPIRWPAGGGQRADGREGDREDHKQHLGDPLV